MSKQDADMLRAIAAGERLGDAHAARCVLERIAYQLDIEAKRYEESEKLQAIGKSAMESIAEMVAALDCDYDRLEELRDSVDSNDSESEESKELAELAAAAGECSDREQAERYIQEHPLSLRVRTAWYDPSPDRSEAGSYERPEEFELLLSTGGPATRIIGELNEHDEPTRARLQAQDWFQPWTDYVQADQDTLLTYCRCFYFGEG